MNSALCGSENSPVERRSLLSIFPHPTLLSLYSSLFNSTPSYTPPPPSLLPHNFSPLYPTSLLSSISFSPPATLLYSFSLPTPPPAPIRVTPPPFPPPVITFHLHPSISSPPYHPLPPLSPSHASMQTSLSPLPTPPHR